MCTAHNSALPFKDNRLQSQATTRTSTFSPYFQPISLQLEDGPEPHPKDADGTVTPAEGPWQGNATPPGTQPQAFGLVKLDFGTGYLFLSRDHLLHSHYVLTPGHKDRDIIGERRSLGSDAAA